MNISDSTGESEAWEMAIESLCDKIDSAELAVALEKLIPAVKEIIQDNRKLSLLTPE